MDKPEGRCILVGIQMDSDGRDLLNWSIGKVAEPGDRVVAVHVYRKSDPCNSSVLNLTKSLDKYLAEYEAFCNVRQVVLVGRLAPGNSIKKVIVVEAKLCAAATVVVGVHKSTIFRGSASLAKYCARKLPPTTSLVAVHGGKVIFERGATILPQGSIIESEVLSVGGDTKSAASLGSFLHPSLGMNSEATIPCCKAKIENGDERSSNAESLRNITDRASVEKARPDPCPKRNDLEHASSLPLLMENMPGETPGWPLLCRTASTNSGGSKDEAARKMSVVQWVMNLPDRSLQSPDSQASSPQSGSPHGLCTSPAYVDLCKELEAILEKNSSNCRWFSHAELENSTNRFSSDKLIGKGGCSRVYRGSLPDGLDVAVKKTKLSEESLREFLLEADIITTVRHPSIVPLMGVSIDGDELISVYNFFSKGSLEENLHGKSGSPLPWNMRYKVAVGIAEALNYLHSDSPRPVIHRDVKSSNILLSDDFEPQLSDFGLAIWAPDASSSITNSDVVGTFGYLAPEYFMYGKVSDKVDVYSFGVVLLELLTGRKPICSENTKGQESLVMWVTKMLEQGDLMDLLDSNLRPDHEQDEIRRMILAATICIRRIAQLRPQMSQVLSLLKGEDQDVDPWINDSHGNNIAEEEADIYDEDYPPSSVASHLGVALQDLDDATSISSIDQNYHHFLEEYLRGRWSRSSSFD